MHYYFIWLTNKLIWVSVLYQTASHRNGTKSERCTKLYITSLLIYCTKMREVKGILDVKTYTIVYRWEKKHTLLCTRCTCILLTILSNKLISGFYRHIILGINTRMFVPERAKISQLNRPGLVLFSCHYKSQQCVHGAADIFLTQQVRNVQRYIQ